LKDDVETEGLDFKANLISLTEANDVPSGVKNIVTEALDE